MNFSFSSASVYKQGPYWVRPSFEMSAGGAPRAFKVEGLIDELIIPFTTGFMDGGNRVDGVTNELLICIIKHRLELFQQTENSCAENDLMIIACEDFLRAAVDRNLRLKAERERANGAPPVSVTLPAGQPWRVGP